MRRLWAISALALIGTTLTAPSSAQPAGRPDVGPTANAVPAGLDRVGFDQKLGAELPLDTVFVDSGGIARPLRDYFGDKPVVIAFVYYECPMLCSLVLNGITASLRAIEFSVGAEFDVVTVSFDPREGPEVAAAIEDRLVARYGRLGSAGGWHVLTGEAAAIDRLTDAAGFRYVWDERHQQYAHAAGIVIATPDGRVSRYLYGIDYPPRDLRLGLVEASRHTIGTAVDQVLLYCFHYDPATGAYSVATMTAVRVGGVVTLATLGGFLWRMFRRERRTRAAGTAGDRTR